MTWSTQQVDSLPGGVRALPRSLRSAWVGAASASVGRGSSKADARKQGDSAVAILLRGVKDLGLSGDALEEWYVHNSLAHPLMQLLQQVGLEHAAGSLHDLTLPDGGALAEPGDFAAWLAEHLAMAMPEPPPAEPVGDEPGGTNDGAALPRRRSVSGSAAIAASGRSDAQWRCDRMPLTLTRDGKDAVERALSRGRRLERRGDEASFDAVIAQLRADGFDDYVTPEGYLKVTVKAARSGVQAYSDGFETWGEYRPIEEVFSAASLASWGLKPFTNDHPHDFVGVHNWAEYAVGVVGGDARQIPGTDGNDYIEVTIVVYDMMTLIAIRDGKVELSAGYSTVLKMEKGRWQGLDYIAVHTQIYINHLALVDAGRAGPLARIALDGFAWQVCHMAVSDGAPPSKTGDAPMANQAPPKKHTFTADQMDAAKAEVKRLVDAGGKVHKIDFETGVIVIEGIELIVPIGQIHEVLALLGATEADPEAPESDPDPVGEPAPAGPDPQMDAAEQQKEAKQVSDDKIAALSTKIDSLTSAVIALNEAKAVSDAQLLSVKAENDRLKAAADAAERARVIKQIADACPKLDLAKIPAPKNDAGAVLDVPLVEIKAAAVVDLAPAYAEAIETYRKAQDGYVAFVDTLYATEMKRAAGGASAGGHPLRVGDTSAGSTGPARNQIVDLNKARRASLGQADTSAAG